MNDGASLQHASIVQIDHRGILIRGPSGSGKTALASELLFRARMAGIQSALVADDYAFLSRDGESGELAAAVPERIAGLIELRGFGVVPVGDDRWTPRTRLVLAVALVQPVDAERVADPGRFARLLDHDLPELALAERQPVSAAHAVFAWLGLAPRLL